MFVHSHASHIDVAAFSNIMEFIHKNSSKRKSHVFV